MTGTLTEFGKELRKLRIDKGEALKEMAEKLGYTSSYLSGIEWGKHNVPVGMVEHLKEAYKLTEEEAARLQDAYVATLTKVSINLEGATKEQRLLVLLFRQYFGTLTDEERKTMLDILEERTNKYE